MNLTFEQVKSAANGAVRIESDERGISFYRFTKKQEEWYEALYQNTGSRFYQNTFSTAGIRLTFITTSETMELKVLALLSCSRTYFSFDVFADGKLVDCLDNFSNVTFTEKYSEAKLELGAFTK
ncbi:MAG: hypothetical protein IJ390_09090, partial [Lachnospiraceae bacterium]|nr:hypothetical protein [Lachnospiraceae bacterium]